jgi:hypothetical protein
MKSERTPPPETGVGSYEVLTVALPAGLVVVACAPVAGAATVDTGAVGVAAGGDVIAGWFVTPRLAALLAIGVGVLILVIDMVCPPCFG